VYWLHGFEPTEPSSSTSRSPPLDLPRTSRKIGIHPTIRSFSSSSSVVCESSTRILWTPTEIRLSSPSGVLGFRLVGIPTTLSQSGWFTNHSKSFIPFSYVICAFTYHRVELLFVLSYIRSRVWGSMEYSGTRCGNCYLIPRRLTFLIWRKILDSAVDVVLECHTPFWENRNEASIRVPRMFKSHV
jgi:hypothetical protein